MSEMDSEQSGRPVQPGRAGARGPREAGPLREKPGTRRRKSLSDKQLAILDFIQRAVAARGYPPSMREIGDAVGLSSLSSVTHQLNQLELSGYLRRDPNRPRALEVLIDIQQEEGAVVSDNPTPIGDAAMVPPASRLRRRRWWTKCSRSPANSWAKASCLCSRSSGTR